MQYLDQKAYAQTINSARNKPVPDLKWYHEHELNNSLLDIQERGIKPSHALPYNYLVNLEDGAIKMTNLKERAVPLIIYDRKRLEADDFYFSYALYSGQELIHSVDAGKYDYEVFGPNGFYRLFKGESRPEIKASLIYHPSENKVQFIINKVDKDVQEIVIDDLYEKSSRIVSLQKDENNIAFSLHKTKGWYDLRISSGNTVWHFAGRLETGKPSVSDPHWQ